MAATFQQLWQATGAKVSELQPASVRALCAPPLACLPPEIAAERLQRLLAVPFADLFSLVAVLNTCRPDDHMVALELLGVVEGDEALEEPAAIEAVIPQLPAPPKPEPLTLPAAPARPVSAISELTAVTSATPLVDQPSRSCKQCGVLFNSSRLRQRFCSRECQGNDHNRRRQAARAAARPIKTCPECRVSFQPQKRDAQRFCSKTCQRAAVYTQQGEIPPWRRPPRSCVVCGSGFMPRKATQKTCSEACSLTWRRQRNNQRHVETARITALVEQFTPPDRWRWLLRQINEVGLEKAAVLAKLEIIQLECVIRLICIEKRR